MGSILSVALLLPGGAKSSTKPNEPACLMEAARVRSSAGVLIRMPPCCCCCCCCCCSWRVGCGMCLSPSAPSTRPLLKLFCKLPSAQPWPAIPTPLLLLPESRRGRLRASLLGVCGQGCLLPRSVLSRSSLPLSPTPSLMPRALGMPHPLLIPPSCSLAWPNTCIPEPAPTAELAPPLYSLSLLWICCPSSELAAPPLHMLSPVAAAAAGFPQQVTASPSALPAISSSSSSTSQPSCSSATAARLWAF
mmetsp:Transcript_26656/g.68672  ORF Transcript_26656/g.68672 Transcript_26656/m.68672 type:complete len:248 (-) Transcript_26656:2889-3632(-)